MTKRLLLISMLTLAGCTMTQPISTNGTLILKPEIHEGSYNTQAVISPYTQASIDHLIVKLYRNGQDLGIQTTIPGAQLGNAVTINHLIAHSTYLIKATAYASNSLCISTNDANCETEVTLTDNDRPTLTSVKVKLIDRLFDGQATSSGVVVTSGGYSPIGQENLAIPKVVTTFAGSGTQNPCLDAVGVAATFANPRGMTIDSAGNLYVADESHERIRKISPSGYVSTLAGSGTAGFADGIDSVASFREPSGVCIDNGGNVYVSDTANHRIRKITPAGIVSTVAGNGTVGFADGTGTNAMFSSPYAIAIDASENLYVADSENHRIRKIAPNGAVSTVAGNGTIGAINGVGTNASFRQPRGVAVDASGNIYVADRTNNLIRKITSTGTVTTLAGSGASGKLDGLGTTATFASPIGIMVDPQGTIYVGGNGDHAVRKITPEGMVTTFAGSGTAAYADGSATLAAFNQPLGIAINAYGDVFVADYSNHRIRRIQ